MIDFKKLRQSLTPQQVNEVICSIGGSPGVPNGTALAYQTICHNELAEGAGMKLFYYPSSCLFFCYSECSESFDIIDLIVKRKHIVDGEIISKFEALEILEKILNIEVETDSVVEDTSDGSGMLEYLRRIEAELSYESKKIPTIQESELNRFPRLPNLNWIEEGILPETQKKFEVGYDPISSCITIPVRNQDGELIGIRCRRLIEEDSKRLGRYGPLICMDKSYTYPISFNLYNLHRTKNNIAATKKAVIFEGEKSCMLEHQFVDIPISVAVQGSNFSIRQASMLKKLEVEEIVIAFDKWGADEEKETYILKLKKLVSKLSLHFKLITVVLDEDNLLDYKDSPIDKGAKTYLKLMENRKELSL